MARHTTITDEQILEAARVVFLEQGVQATSADVALRAGVSEGTIFKRFHTKSELFRTALLLDQDEPAWEKSLSNRIGKGDIRRHFRELLGQSIEYLRIIVPLVLMASSNPSEEPCQFKQPDPPPLRALRKLSSYVEAEMRLGRIRRKDPEVVARMMMASAWHYAHFELLFKAQEVLPLPETTYIRGVVDLMWSALSPLPPKRNAR